MPAFPEACAIASPFPPAPGGIPELSGARPAAALPGPHPALTAGLVLAAVLLSFFFMLGRTPLFDVDEGAFAEATLEMFQRGDFLTTYLNGEPRYDKPILIYWLQAASVALLGGSEFAFRLPSALCALVWSLLTYAFARRCFDAATGRRAALLLSCSLLPYVIGRAATADALLNCLLAACLFSAYLHLREGGRFWRYATFGSMGLAFLAKGPVAVVIPLAVTLSFCLLRRDLRTFLRVALDPIGLALFAVIALPWFILVANREGYGFLQGFFFRHNLERFSGTLQGHGGGFLYYLPVLVLGTMPFTNLMVGALRRLRVSLRDEASLFLWLWFGFVLVFFSFSGTKLPHYLLYGMSGLFILMARQVPANAGRWLLAPALLLVLLLAALPVMVPALTPRIPDAYYREAVADLGRQIDSGYYLACAATGVLLLMLTAWRAPATLRLGVGGLSISLLLSGQVVPLGAALQQGPVKEAALLCRARGYDVVMWGLNAPSFSVYRGQPTVGREPRPGEILITKTKRLTQFKGYEVLYARHGISLVRLAP